MATAEEMVETFHPKETTAVAVGRFTVHLYPKITSSMPESECAHAFHHNVAALRHLDIRPALYLDTLGDQLNLNTTVEGLKFDWMCHFAKNWANFNNLTILAFHDSAGAPLNTATLPCSLVLKPLVNGLTTEARRPGDVAFVRLRCRLDYAEFMVEPRDPHPMEVLYYLQLPQTTVVVTDHTGAEVSVTTFAGPSDLSSLSVFEVRTQILCDVTYQEPVDLPGPAINVIQARIDTEELKQHIEDKILSLAVNTIEKQIFSVLCPNYSSRPCEPAMEADRDEEE